MYARKVSLQLKPNSVAEFTRTIEKDIIPLLRKQPGFQDEIAFVVPGGTEAVSVSLWDRKEHAAIVGARDATPAGVRRAEAVARHLVEPAGGQASDAGLLVPGHRLRRYAEGVGRPGLHLAEHEEAALTDDEVERVIEALSAGPRSAP